MIALHSVSFVLSKELWDVCRRHGTSETRVLTLLQHSRWFENPKNRLSSCVGCVSVIALGHVLNCVGRSGRRPRALTRSCLASRRWKTSRGANAASAWSCLGCTLCRTAAGPTAPPGLPGQTSWRPSLRSTATDHPSRSSPPETHTHAHTQLRQSRSFEGL